MADTISVLGGQGGTHFGIPALGDSSFAAPGVPDTIIKVDLGELGNSLGDPGSGPIQIHAGQVGTGFVQVNITPTEPAVQVRAGDATSELLNTVIGANSVQDLLGTALALGLPDGSSPVQQLHIGIPDVAFLSVAVNQAAGPGDPFLQIRAGDANPGEELNYVLPMPGAPAAPGGGLPVPGIPGLPVPTAASSSSDNLTLGSGVDTVVALGNATAAGLSGVVAGLGVDSVISTVGNVVPGLGGLDAFSAQSSGGAFALGADSLAAAQVVSDFVSAPVAQAGVVTAVVDTTTSAVGSVVSLDQGLTTIQVTGLVNKITSPFGG